MRLQKSPPFKVGLKRSEFGVPCVTHTFLMLNPFNTTLPCVTTVVRPDPQLQCRRKSLRKSCSIMMYMENFLMNYDLGKRGANSGRSPRTPTPSIISASFVH